MVHVLVRKIFNYDPTFGGIYSRYDGYKLITRQVDLPEVGIQGECIALIDEPPLSPILHSTLRRGVDSAAVWAKRCSVATSPIPQLNEVLFDISQLLTEQEFVANGSNMVRAQFVEAFINDRLLEKRAEIKARIDFVLALIGKYPAEHRKVLAISHSFIMKIWQTYLAYPQLFDEPELIRLKLSAEQKTFSFGMGFDFEL